MKRKRGQWEAGNLKNAVSSVLEGKLNIRQASKSFEIPKSTIASKVKTLSAGGEITLEPYCCRKNSIFTKVQEEELCNHVLNLEKQLMPLTKKEFQQLAYKYAQSLNVIHPFNVRKKVAGKSFYYKFLKRNPTLSLRTPSSTSIQRKNGFTKEKVEIFFYKLTELMAKYEFSSSRIFNADETGISIVHHNSKVLSAKGKKTIGKITSGERGGNVTVLLCINASGTMFIPPLIVFPRKRMTPELTKDAPDGCIFDAQPTGWICSTSFLKWLKHFNNIVQPTQENPVLLITDGHASHKDYDVIMYAREYNIHMLSLPPHSTHKLQPLDRVVMKPFKNCYSKACSDWMRKYTNFKINLRDVAGLINIAFINICKMELAKSAFASTGIYPVNSKIFDESFSQNYIYNEPQENVIYNSSMSFIPNFNAELSTTFSKDLNSVYSTTNWIITEEHNNIRQCIDVPHSLPESSCSLTLESAFDELNNNRCRSILKDLCPLPSDVPSEPTLRKRAVEQSEVLTSSPFLNQKKRKLSTADGNLEKVKNIINSTTLKTNLKKSQIQSNKVTFNKENESNVEKFSCIICNETFEEDWIQCSMCLDWAHEACANLESRALYYSCDYCFSKLNS